MPMQSNPEWATIGKIVALFGVRGEVKVHSLSDIPDRFTSLSTVYLTPDYQPFSIESVRPYKGDDMLLLRFSGFNDANAADALRNRIICIPISDLATLPPNSYYHHDILGLQVFTLNNQQLGPITDIMETGSNDVYVIQSPNHNQILIPALKDIVKQIDLIRRVMYIDPMPGLLDDAAIIDDPNRPDTSEVNEEA